MASCRWSTTLPNDLLLKILSKLDLADHIRFGCVCKSWRSVAMEDNPPTNKPLFLVRSDDPERLICRILQTSFRKLVLPLRIPTKGWLDSFLRFFPLRPPTKSNNILTIDIIGSFEGWLVVLVRSPRRLFLSNPVAPATDTPIPLPPVPLRPRNPNGYICSFHKVVLSSPPFDDKCVMVLLMDNGCRLYFCRLRDPAWTIMIDVAGGRPDRGLTDIAFHKDRLYTIDRNGMLIAFDFGINSKPTKVLQITLPTDFGTCDHLVSVHDKLWLITITIDLPQVFEIDPTTSSGYVHVEGFEDKVLFVSNTCSISLSAGDYPEFLPDHVYHIPRFHGSCFGYYCVDYKSTLEERRITIIDNNLRYPLFFALFRNRCFTLTF